MSAAVEPRSSTLNVFRSLPLLSSWLPHAATETRSNPANALRILDLLCLCRSDAGACNIILLVDNGKRGRIEG
jgi:hypothetical protein